MGETNPIPNVTETAIQPEASPRAAFEWGIRPVLNAQADMLAGAEATVTDWLHRRYEAIVDTQQLVASVHPGTNMADALKAQQEWLSRSFRRVAADLEAYQSTSQQLMDRAPSWFPNGGWMWFQQGTGNAASQAAATRAAGRPLRMAHKPG
jgi:hypothetical protein